MVFINNCNFFTNQPRGYSLDVIKAYVFTVVFLFNNSLEICCCSRRLFNLYLNTEKMPLTYDKKKLRKRMKRKPKVAK